MASNRITVVNISFVVGGLFFDFIRHLDVGALQALRCLQRHGARMTSHRILVELLVLTLAPRLLRGCHR